KVVIAACLTGLIGMIVFLAGMGASFGGGQQQVQKEVAFEKSVAYQYYPQLYARESAIEIYKYEVCGIIRKLVYRGEFADINKYNCDITFKDASSIFEWSICTGAFYKR